MSFEPIPDPSGDGVLADHGSDEGRRAFIRWIITNRLTHHDNLTDAISCATRATVETWVLELCESSTGVPEGEHDQGWIMFTDTLMNTAQIPLYLLITLGEMAKLVAAITEGEPLPEDIAALAANT